ncbi:MAG: bifunctional folylpolyglutamate synthase/dihydrofolate synthase [Proteobacteria bacterium]|nr:bifunctional folylpolyglutamate synthase/dihydrofolate synthase [Pseudomonadota bacterium]
MSKSLADWLCRINSVHHKEIDLSLDRLQKVIQDLSLRPRCPVITVGGTNGKGSTCAMLEAIYTKAGYRAGVFASPHLLRFNERIRLANAEVDDDAIISSFVRIDCARGDVSLTYFEFSFLAALDIFLAQDVDLIILEVGLGGRFDATNVLDPICAIVTNVGLDHMEYLGETREKIGAEKAAIFRGGDAYSICGDEDPPQSILDTASAIDTDLQLIDRDFGFVRDSSSWKFWSTDGSRMNLAFPLMQGEHQLANASVSIQAATLLKNMLPIDAAAIREGLLTAKRLGRFQALPSRPLVVLDVAHNVASITILVRELKRAPFKGKTRVIFGVMADKQYVEMITLLTSVADQLFVCALEGERSADPDVVVARATISLGSDQLISWSSVAKAMDKLLEISGSDDRIVICGSFLTVSAALNHPFVSGLVHNRI